MDLYPWLFRIWRPKRFAIMLAKLSPAITDNVLDVGGTVSFWKGVPPFAGSLAVLNLEGAVEQFDANITVIKGDGCALPFADKSYDIVFSNSTIEHVGCQDRQLEFACEIRRVARSYWVQTPSRFFPVEPHFLGLFIHWLPKRWWNFAARWFSLRGISHNLTLAEIVETNVALRWISKKELIALFPGATIYVERVMGWPKSYVAWRKW